MKNYLFVIRALHCIDLKHNSVQRWEASISLLWLLPSGEPRGTKELFISLSTLAIDTNLMQEDNLNCKINTIDYNLF